jgi:protein-arginine kinase activator protein McsA
MECPVCNATLKQITQLDNRFHCFNCNKEVKVTKKNIAVFDVQSNGELKLFRIERRGVNEMSNMPICNYGKFA